MPAWSQAETAAAIKTAYDAYQAISSEQDEKAWRNSLASKLDTIIGQNSKIIDELKKLDATLDKRLDDAFVRAETRDIGGLHDTLNSYLPNMLSPDPKARAEASVKLSDLLLRASSVGPALANAEESGVNGAIAALLVTLACDRALHITQASINSDIEAYRPHFAKWIDPDRPASFAALLNAKRQTIGSVTSSLNAHIASSVVNERCGAEHPSGFSTERGVMPILNAPELVGYSRQINPLDGDIKYPILGPSPGAYGVYLVDKAHISRPVRIDLVGSVDQGYKVHLTLLDPVSLELDVKDAFDSLSRTTCLSSIMPTYISLPQSVLSRIRWEIDPNAVESIEAFRKLNLDPANALAENIRALNVDARKLEGIVNQLQELIKEMDGQIHFPKNQ